MEVISIEKKTFEEMTLKFDEFVKRIENVCHRNSDKGMGEWLDNQEVCKLLNICPRTLQFKCNYWFYFICEVKRFYSDYHTYRRNWQHLA